MSKGSIILILATLLALGLAASGRWRAPPPHPLAGLIAAEPARPLAGVNLVDEWGAAAPFSARIKRPTVVAFWASWCVPCLEELPSLGRFQALAATAGIDLLTVTEDRDGAKPARQTLNAKGLAGLSLMVDADGSVAAAHGIRGIPTALLVNAKGEEVARLEGAAEWDNPAALEKVRALIGPAAVAN